MGSPSVPYGKFLGSLCYCCSDRTLYHYHGNITDSLRIIEYGASKPVFYQPLLERPLLSPNATVPAPIKIMYSMYISLHIYQ